MILKSPLILLLSLLFISNLYSSIAVTPDKYEFVIGDKLTLKIELTYPSEAVVDLSNVKNYSTDSFELIGLLKNSIKEVDGFITETSINEYIVFAEKGEQYIDPIKYSYVIGEEIKNFESDSIKIIVNSILKGNISYLDSTGQQKSMPLDSLKMVLPIKDIDIYRLSSTEKKYIISFIILLIILGVLFYFFLKRKRKNTYEIEKIEKVIKVPAHIKAFEKLDELKNKNYLSKGDFKEFAAELSLITRLFLEDRYEFPGAELPTPELEEKITEYILKQDLLEGMYKLLEITDFVKFAKFIPLEAELKSFLDFAYELVDKLKDEGISKNV